MLSLASIVSSRTNTIVVWVSILTFICSLGACGKRKLVESTSGMDTPEHLWIRVLLFDNIKECQLTVKTSFNVIDQETLATKRFNKTTKPIKVELEDGKIAIDEHVFGTDLVIQPSKPFVLSINGKRYRGNLRLLANPQHSFDAFNLVPLEAYLAGVIGAEMPNYWEPEALQAQAIAARTYCLYYKNRFGTKRNWDVSKTQATQVYRGVEVESATVEDAVNKTAGKILVCNYNEDKEEIFPTYYSSTCGGHTEGSTDVYGGKYFKSLKGVACPYCKTVAKMSFFYWSMVEFPSDDVSNRIIKRYPKLQKLGKIKTIEPSKVSKHGRIFSVKLVGENDKSEVLRGEDFRLTLDPSGKKIKSSLCQILKIDNKFRFYGGRGYGHGVGMCQCGAEGMARKGYRAEEILEYYYPGSKIVDAY